MPIGGSPPAPTLDWRNWSRRVSLMGGREVQTPGEAAS